jgi:ribonuclease HI
MPRSPDNNKDSKKARVLEELAASPTLSSEQRAVLREAAELLREAEAKPPSSDSSRGALRRRKLRQQQAAEQDAQRGGSNGDPDAILWSDGAARGNPGPAGLGAIIKRPSGEVLATCSEAYGEATNNAAEYAALLMGLRRALELGLRRIEIRADSELLIKQLGGDYRVKNAALKPLFEQAQRLLQQFDWTRLRHVRREYNSEADRLANQGIDGV